MDGRITSIRKSVDATIEVPLLFDVLTVRLTEYYLPSDEVPRNIVSE